MSLCRQEFAPPLPAGGAPPPSMKLGLGKTVGMPLGKARGKGGFAFGRKVNSKSKSKPALSKKPAVGDVAIANGFPPK